MANIRRSVVRAIRNEHTILFVLAITLGAAAAYGAIGFRLAVDGLSVLGFGAQTEIIVTAIDELVWWHVLLVPAGGGLAIGIFLHFTIQGGRVHGIAQVIEASALARGRMPMRAAVISALGSAASLGVGSSTGREGPVVHLGAALSAWVAARLKLGQSLSRTLLGCGAAAAIGALFNAPIAGVFFALEIVVGRHALRNFAPVVVAAVTGTVIGRSYFGAEPAFIVPSSHILSLWEFPAFALLGVVCAAAAISFMHAIFSAGRLAEISGLPGWARPAIAGLVIGALALYLPQVVGVGYEATDAALGARYGLELLLVLIVAKILATGFCLGFGFGGGVFSPSLVLGAFVGGAFGIVAGTLFPGAYSGTSAYALIGMGAVAGAVLGAPLSTILIIFELTGDYEMTIAVMIATVIASQLTQLLYGQSYFHRQLALDGVSLGRGQELQILGDLNIEAVMQTRIVTVAGDTPAGKLNHVLSTAPNFELFVVDEEGGLVGVITMRELMNEEGAVAGVTQGVGPTAADIARPYETVVSLHDNVGQALEVMRADEDTRLPVVSDRHSYKLLGYVREADILRAVNRRLMDATTTTGD